MHKIYTLILTGSLIIISPSVYSLGDLWNATKDTSKNIAKGVSDTAGKVSDTASETFNGDKPSTEQIKKEIDSNAEKALMRLFIESSTAKKLYESGAGYAVFDSREFAFMIKTGMGSGVAVNNNKQSRTYMKMASGGLNLGGGIKYIQVIFLFPDNKSLDTFINDGWNAEGDASAIGGSEGGHLGVTLANGTTIYELTDTGLMLKMSISGTRYWKNDELN
ncbi:MAG: hypothetical protein KZQ83_11040 [gamma proteobacterium symbiont of Taylorina sp.]|nr:hypothetical protein [gamma proteobacterium symbiont of Taylorina sp.]